jgi:hypothetical protein
MPDLALELPPDLLARVQTRAAFEGKSVESYLLGVFERAAAVPTSDEELPHPSGHPVGSNRHTVSLVLWAAWDPIGDVPPDEYDMYAPRIAGMLEAGANLGELAAELRRIRTERIELDDNDDADVRTASKLLDWHAAQRA